MAGACVECGAAVKARGLCGKHYNAQYYRQNVDSEKARQKAWYAANPAKAAAQRARRDPEVMRAMARDYHQRNRLARIAAEANRKAKRLGLPGILTAAALRARIDFFGNRCWLCGTTADSIDHVKPFAKGGPNWPSNIRPACLPCNVRRQDTWEGVR